MTIPQIPLVQANSQTTVQHIPIVIRKNPPLAPPPLMAVPSFLVNKYAPLALPQILNDMPHDYMKLLPQFTGEESSFAQNHLEDFCAFIENFNVEQLDVVLRLFVQYLDGEARKWFNTLGNRSITNWEEM